MRISVNTTFFLLKTKEYNIPDLSHLFIYILKNKQNMIFCLFFLLNSLPILYFILQKLEVRYTVK
jgi:hypothetical protein